MTNATPEKPRTGLWLGDDDDSLSRRDDRSEDGQRDRDATAINERSPLAATTERQASSWRSHTNSGAGVADDLSLRSSRRSLVDQAGETSRFSQDHEDVQPGLFVGTMAQRQPRKSAPDDLKSAATVYITEATSDIGKESAPLKQKIAYAYQKLLIEGILRRKPLLPSKDGRHIPLNPPHVGPGGLVDVRSNKPYISNFIRSSRYTVWDFLPKQLIFQFSKLGNFYFLVMGTVQAIPGISTVGRWTTLGPLAGFVAFSMAKEGYDDYRRYQLDKSENRSLTWVLTHGVRKGCEKPRMGGWRNQAMKYRRVQEADEDVMLQDLEDGSFIKQDEANDWMNVQWQHVQVGDVVRLHRDDAVPADMVLLHATGPNGIAYIETMALDGETNLKAKQACPLLAERCSTTDSLRATQATVVSENPNIDLYGYDGKVTVNGETLPLSLNNVVYRGSILRNTSMAIGLVINSGEECKIRMNATKNVHTKSPAIQSLINMMVLFQICIVIMLAVGLTIGYYVSEHRVLNKSFYLVSKGFYNANVPFKDLFFGHLIMFNTLIPLSLYVSLEIIKLGQLVMLQDEGMYDPATDTPMVANTSTILENLGQVTHVFSDKTGTLTENMMRFRKMSVAGVAFLHDMDMQTNEYVHDKKGKQAVRIQQLETIPLEDDEDFDRNRPGPPRQASVSQWKSSVHPNEEPEMKTEELLDYIRQRPNTTFSRKAKHFLLCIALCHTCLPEVKDGGEIEYQAASPDELALVEAARDLGYLLIDRPAQCITLQLRDADGTPTTETYQVLDVIEFSSKRKRMSIIIRMPDGRIGVFCKGADNVIMSRLKLTHLAEQKAKDINRRASIRKIFEQDKAIRRMSMQVSTKDTPRNSIALKRAGSTDRLESLRRSIGRRSTDLNRLSQAEGVASWLHMRQTEEMPAPRESVDLLRNPRQSLSRVPSVDNLDARIDESVAANEGTVFEKCFQHVDDFASEGLRTLLYAYRYIDEDTYAQWKQQYREAETSLVDRQERIEAAGEKIEEKFELAGATAIEDKLQDGVPETIDKLRRANIKVWMLTGDKRETAINIGHSARVCKPFSEIYILDATQGNLREAVTAALNDVGRGMVPHSVVVVDGQTLAIIEADKDVSMLFYDLIIRADSIICCRASPSQKANLVKSIRRHVPKSMTLAIGDGANDIGMIQASHVGIGISGREGLQAARISDYSIAQFRFLQRLLFVHGRWNYIRTGKYALATFWKEMFFFLMQAHYQRFSGYTGTSLFESWSLALFNTVFTSLPVILLGIFDKDLSASTLLAIPELYSFGQQGRGFSYFQYVGWMIMGIAGSFMVFYLTVGVYNNILFTEDTSLFAMGSVCFTVGVIFINIKLLVLEFHNKTIIPLIGLVVELVGWFFWNVLISNLYPQQLGPYMVRKAFMHNFGRQLSWWTTVLLALIGPVILELIVQSIRRVYWPMDQDLMQRIEQDADAKQILKKCAAMGMDDPEVGNIEGIDIDNVVVAERDPLVPQTDSGRSSRSRSPVAVTARASLHGLPARKPSRVSHDDYRPPNFTPPAEERENPLEGVKGRNQTWG